MWCGASDLGWGEECGVYGSGGVKCRVSGLGEGVECEA